MTIDDSITFYRIPRDKFIKVRKAIAEDFVHANFNDKYRTSLKYTVEFENYTNETICISGSNICSPTQIYPIGGTESLSLKNRIIGRITSGENVLKNKSVSYILSGNVVEINISIDDLKTGPMFIAELDSYMFLEGYRSAVSKFILEDSAGSSPADSVTVSNLDARRNNQNVYYDFKALAKMCSVRKELIRVCAKKPELLKNIQISILDTYFIPSDDNRVIYNHNLDDDEFTIRIIRDTKDEVLLEQYNKKFSIAKLNETGMLVVDQNQIETMFGKFCEMVVFNNENSRLDYFHECKSNQKYDDENIALAMHSGNYQLNKEVSRLRVIETNLNREITDLKEENSLVSKHRKELIAEKRILEKRVDDLVSGGIEAKSTELIIDKLNVDKIKLENARLEMAHEKAITKYTTKSTVTKVKSDNIKSILTAITAILAAIPLIIAGYFKIQSILKPA